MRDPQVVVFAKCFFRDESGCSRTQPEDRQPVLVVRQDGHVHIVHNVRFLRCLLQPPLELRVVPP